MTARYVVLHHTGINEPHYDLMFDIGDAGRLITWRSPIWPIDRPVALTRLPDHRREYLSYEGEISGHRGRVDRVAEGSCELTMGEMQWTVGWVVPAWTATSFVRQDGDRWLATVHRVVQY